ncbi:MAG: HlyC/CorC family transporter [Verrucomicrobia bacterium]|nr:HlyC/CorC family transporter [Verrucomicrobiota bacterium]
MSELSAELLILFLLLMANGIFAMAEIAVVSARKAYLKQLADKGNARAKSTLAIAREPGRFLSAVQVGITLMVVLAGDVGGGTLTRVIEESILGFDISTALAHKIAKGLVVAGITLSSVVIGELIPKRLGLANPERIALYLAPAINNLARIVSPMVSLLTWLTDGIMKLFGLRTQTTEKPVSDEEVNILIEQGMHAGVFNKTEKDMVAGVLELDRLPVTALMTPRPKIVFLNLDDPEEANWRRIVASGHSYFPVYQGNRDHVLGLVSVKALWAHSAIGLSTSLKNLMVPALIVPETMTAIQLLETFKKSSRHIALICDEFGAIQGLTSLIDVLEAIVGDMPAQGRRDAPGAKQREDGSWLVDATLSIGEVKSMFNLDTLPHENDADFQTLGGFVMTQFGRIPAAGDYFDHAGWRFEVVDMDRHRVDKVLVAKTPAAAVEKVAG